MRKMKITKNRYLQVFAATVAFLALVRVVFPGEARSASSVSEKPDSISGAAVNKDSSHVVESALSTSEKAPVSPKWYNADGTLVKNRIYSVPTFKTTFPDSNNVQMAAASKYGVKPVKDRKDAESRKK